MILRASAPKRVVLKVLPRRVASWDQAGRRLLRTEVRRAAVRLIEQLEAVPSAPGAAGARVWHLLSRGWGPRAGRPRRRRVLQLPSSFAKSLVWRHKPGAPARPGVFSEEQRVDLKLSQIHLA